MAKKLTPPSLTDKEFDAIEPQLRAALKKWWKDEAEDFDASVAGTSAVWEGMPEIDSKAVVKASPVIRQFTGGDLDPKMIRKGGYSSFDDLADDLLPKLRTACSAVPQDQPEHAESMRETLNARRR